MQQKFGVFADVAVDELHSLFINFDVVVDDKWEEGNNAVATDNCSDGGDIDVELFCIVYTYFTDYTAHISFCYNQTNPNRVSLWNETFIS